MHVSQNIIKKYGVDSVGPYYTSYPTLSEWSDDFLQKDFVKNLEEICKSEENNSFALYIHFPYCVKRCHFCVCNSYITHKKEIKQKALEYIFRELDLISSYLFAPTSNSTIKEVHIGGGSPSYLDRDDFDLLIKNISNRVDIKTLDEFAIEIDPRSCDKEKMRHYAAKGINRLSFGIQDFNPQVQEAVNRVQPPLMVEQLLTPDIRKSFQSVNFDIMYGLPYQTRKSFMETIELVKKFSPDRITLLRYAHIPHIKKNMSLIDESKIVDNDEKTKMFVDTIESLTSAGYDYIGIDHFSKPTDELSKAFKSKTGWRDFGGFTPGRIRNTIGIGPSATSAFGNYYGQNVYNLKEYYNSGVGCKFPLERGLELTKDDIIRREVIFGILCNRGLVWKEIEGKYQINCHKYFNYEIQALTPLVEDGLIEISENGIETTEVGKFFTRHICRVFDKYLRKKEYEIHGT